jgi:hypothetical protein
MRFQLSPKISGAASFFFGAASIIDLAQNNTAVALGLAWASGAMFMNTVCKTERPKNFPDSRNCSSAKPEHKL